MKETRKFVEKKQKTRRDLEETAKKMRRGYFTLLMNWKRSLDKEIDKVERKRKKLQESYKIWEELYEEHRQIAVDTLNKYRKG